MKVYAAIFVTAVSAILLIAGYVGRLHYLLYANIYLSVVAAVLVLIWLPQQAEARNPILEASWKICGASIAFSTLASWPYLSDTELGWTYFVLVPVAFLVVALVAHRKGKGPKI